MNEEDLNVEEEEERFQELSVEEEEERVDPRTLLTQEQLSFFTQIFSSLDPEKKEKVPVKVIGNVIRLMGLNPTKAEIKDLIKELDPKNKGKKGSRSGVALQSLVKTETESHLVGDRDLSVIDFPTFLLPIAQRINEEPETHEDIIAAFKILDEDGNGFLYSDVLTDFLMSLAEDLDDLEMELLLKMADPKGTGKINYVDFVEKIMGVKQAKKEKKDKKKGGKKKKKK